MRRHRGVSYISYSHLLDFGIASTVLAACAGCSSGPKGLPLPDVNPAATAAAAIEQFDANGDASLDETELAKCPPLAGASANYDSNNDRKLTAEEIAARLGAIAGPNSAYVTTSCSVTYDGVPLEGATVKLRPPQFVGDAAPTAEGTTDASGIARPSIPADFMPPQLKDTPLVYPGLYHVEITHPERTLSARYNTATELGFEVDPTTRESSGARFDLKP
jgi:hypothetical protein